LLTPGEYRELLRSALPPVVDADTIEPAPRTLFTPDSHRNALDPDVTVVRGGRGVGKTVWFKALQNNTLRGLAAEQYQLERLSRIEPLPGFGSERTSQYPSQRVLEHLINNNADPKDIWTTVALVALGMKEVKEQGSWQARVQWLQSHPEEAEQALIDADDEARERGVTKLLLFDALDRLHSKREYTDALVRGILQLALDLRTSTRRLRAKVFIRHDMFSEAQLNFSDASKLTANAADLTWSPTSLYGLLFHHLGNSDNNHAEKFRNETGWAVSGQGIDIPPRSLLGDRAQQQELFTQLAGRYMGTDHRKGYTYTWLPNHLTDGKGQVSPRSFLSALLTATKNTETNFPTSKVALYWDAIRQGVQTASQIRVEEVREDIPWVYTAIEPLRGLQVPIEQSDVERRWSESDLRTDLAELDDATKSDDEAVDGSKPPPTGPLHTAYTGLIEELIALGVMTRRTNGKLDLPDVYRIAFDLGRKGGVPRVRP
jgi:hypothetical protein